MLQLDPQLVLSRHLDMPFALDHGDDLHRVDVDGKLIGLAQLRDLLRTRIIS
jgi:hypothetical protein